MLLCLLGTPTMIHAQDATQPPARIEAVLDANHVVVLQGEDRALCSIFKSDDDDDYKVSGCKVLSFSQTPIDAKNAQVAFKNTQKDAQLADLSLLKADFVNLLESFGCKDELPDAEKRVRAIKNVKNFQADIDRVIPELLADGLLELRGNTVVLKTEKCK